MDQELQISPEEHGIFLIESANSFSDDTNRKKTIEIMFEKLQFNKFYSWMKQPLALYASGRTNGIVMDIGHSITELVPIWNGEPVQQLSMTMKYGGVDVTRLLQKLLNQKGYSFTPSAELNILNELKEKMCYVAMDFDAECKKDGLKKEYELPDGGKINVDKAPFECVEGLFIPRLFDGEEKEELLGVGGCVGKVVGKMEVDKRKDMYGNIVLCGGSSMFKGIVERLEKEVKGVAGGDGEFVKIVAGEDRMWSAWIGGSILCEMSSFDTWITSEQYYDVGVDGIVEKYYPSK